MELRNAPSSPPFLQEYQKPQKNPKLSRYLGVDMRQNWNDLGRLEKIVPKTAFGVLVVKNAAHLKAL
jgi:hypothetical protein